MQQRSGLQKLLSDVISGYAPFEYILVYDVSRWGRFQDTDEAAHYEFICRRAGKKLIYCAEPFDNDGSAMASIIKGLKRVMAGEYSRELSDKVHRGQSRFASMGYHVGARAPYGTRRLLIGSDGKARGVLEFGERKAMQTDRVILVPGPEEEINTIKKIYEWFNNTNCNYQDIADRLNIAQITPPAGMQYWNRHQIKSILSNVKYVGTMIYNRTSAKLSTPKVRNAKSDWIEVPNAFEAIVTEDQFENAADRRTENPRKHRKRDLISHLQSLLSKHGYLSGVLLRRLKNGPAPETYVKHFGSIDAALAAAGYDRSNDPRQSVRKHAATRSKLNVLVPWFVNAFKSNGYHVVRESLSSIRVNSNHHIRITLPLFDIAGKREQIHFDRRASVIVAVAINGIENDCLVLDPLWYPYRTISLSSSMQIEKVKNWRCKLHAAPAQAMKILQEKYKFD